MSRHVLTAILVGCCLATSARADDAKDQLIVETVLRIESFQYATASEKVKGAIGRYLEKNRGSDEYFELVERFAIADQGGALAELAAAEPPSPRAAALLVKLGGAEAIKNALVGAGERRAQFLASLGSVNDPAAVAALAALLPDSTASHDAAKALAGSTAGQAKLLELAESGDLPDHLHSGVGLALATSADPKVRERAAKVLPMPATLDGGELAPVAELVARRGDAAKGKLVYQRACFTCHKVGATGIDFGPALTEIGDKLAREALYAAILAPSEAVSFGYEGFELTTKSGSKVIGYVSSDGAEALVMRVPGGIEVSTPRPEIVSKRPLGVSLMPSNLQATMKEAELVDLVEYLTTLRK